MIILVNDYQIKQMFCSLLLKSVDDYDNCDTLDEFIQRLGQDGDLRIPRCHTVYIIKEKTTVFSEIAKPNRSWLIRNLMYRPNDTALVVDALHMGKNGMYFMCLVRDLDQVREWLDQMGSGRMHLTIRPVDADYHVLVAAVSCFTRFAD